MVILQQGFEPIPGYTLEKKLGAGSFGVVWSAHGPGHTRVALKFLNLHHAGGAKEFEAISAIKNVRHPNLLPITGYWLLDSNGIPLSSGHASNASGHPCSAVLAPPETFVIAMVAADRNLDEVLRSYQKDNEPGIPAEELIGYMEDAAKGLDYLNAPRHDLGDGRNVAIQHRDVKPENILVVGDSAVLCDFGVSRACHSNDLRTTGMIGSPAFISPESIDGRSPNSRSDQYSLALTYYYLRTGSYAVQTANQHVAIQGHLTGHLDFSRVGGEEQKQLKRATHLDPSQRFRSCRDFVRAVGHAATDRPEILCSPTNPSKASATADTKEAMRCQSTTTPDSDRDRRAVMDRIDRINTLHQSGRPSDSHPGMSRSEKTNRTVSRPRLKWVRRFVMAATVAACLGGSVFTVAQSGSLKAGSHRIGTETARSAVRASVKHIVTYSAMPAEADTEVRSQDSNAIEEAVTQFDQPEPMKFEAGLVEDALDPVVAEEPFDATDSHETEPVAPAVVPIVEAIVEPEDVAAVAKSASAEAIERIEQHGWNLSEDQASLDLSGERPTAELLQFLAEIPSIKSVSAEASEFNDQHLNLLAEALPNLHSLFLANTQVTNQGISSMSEMLDLSRLDLSSCDIDDDALEHLESLTNLHVIGLRGTQVTGRGLQRLSEALHNNVVIQGPRFNLLGGKRIGTIH